MTNKHQKQEQEEKKVRGKTGQEKEEGEKAMNRRR